jgi:hypothetical protein
MGISLVSLQEINVASGKVLRSSTFQLHLSRFGHTSLCPPV